MRQLVTAIMIVAALSIPTVTVAGPLVLNFAGNWAHHDSLQDSPEFWNAMAAAGVVQDAPLTFSLLIDDIDSEQPNPNLGAYTIYGSVIQVGTLTLTSGLDTLWLDRFSMNTGGVALAGPSAGVWSPSYMQMNFGGGGLSSDALTAAIPHLNSFSIRGLFIGFTSPTCGLCLGTSRLTLTSVEQVPEPPIIFAVASGMLALLRWRNLRFRRRAH